MTIRSDRFSPMQATFKRQITLPDPTVLERHARCPDLGPRILFFSGGTALKDLCRELITYTHNSIHIITPFDSGGSSAILRKEFDMPAIGDLRSRLMALADRTVRGNPEIRTLFSYRLSGSRSQGALERELQEMILGDHPLIGVIPRPMRTIIRRYIHRFYDNMDRFFDLRGANIGNLVLTGGFLANDRDLESILFIVSSLVKVRGYVTAVVPDNLHLGARLRDGSTILGQHALTGKETAPITSPIEEIFLCDSLDLPQKVSCTISEQIAALIQSADLICFPMGSFYTSLIANVLPHGVGRAVQTASCPKVYIPSTGHDPEAIGMNLADQVTTLARYLRRDDPGSIALTDILNFILLDRTKGIYQEDADGMTLEKMGVTILDVDLFEETPGPSFHPARLAEILISLT
jgi:CofD-related protein of GAK system